LDVTESKFPTLALHVAGRWITRASGGERIVVDPSDESALGVLPLAGVDEIKLAAQAAADGFQIWQRKLAHERYVIIRRAAELMRQRAG